LKNIRLA